MPAHAMTLPPESPRTRVDATLGMVIALGAWSMAFGSLFLAFFVLRSGETHWPPPGVELPSFALASVATGLLLASSVALHVAVSRLRAGRGFAGAWALALLLGAAFAALQAHLWLDLMARGAGPSAGTYAALFYGLTWIHAAHVACGLVGLLWIALRAGRYGAGRQVAPRNVALFWHFVDAVWIVLFLSFFVL